MAAETLQYRWGPESFLLAWDAGAFDDQRVEMVEGEIWPVVIGRWHGATTGRVMRALPNDRFTVTTESLVTPSSVPDPDCWVRPVDAQPTAQRSRRLSAWRPEDVLLVVEVSDETLQIDLGVKVRVYAAAGFPRYWVVCREGVYAHTGPTPFGYRHRTLHVPGETVPLGFASHELQISDLLAAP